MTKLFSRPLTEATPHVLSEAMIHNSAAAATNKKLQIQVAITLLGASRSRMAPNQREIQRQLSKKYNIVFDGPIDSIQNPTWPGTCNAIFRHIQELGKKEYAQYREGISADFARVPWKYQVQSRAKRIADKAKQCINARKNESGWRLSLESEVMARFTVEIACRICRGRLWRSEQEVTANTQSRNSINDPNSLQARQRRRQPCECNPSDLSRDIQDQGISPLFDDRAEEAIQYARELLDQLPTREERPDRVWGLQNTKRFARLLQLNRNIRSSPFKPDGEPIAFPFLIIEAKSEKGSDAFTNIQTQTSFAIRELLMIQQGLARAADEDVEWDAGPLVWFIAYKGEQWRVHTAYVDERDGKVFYRVVRLWSGEVDSLDNALRLLLIIDYIADWARDIYREGIARSLYKLASSDSTSLAQDEDIFSLAGNVADWISANPDGDDPGKCAAYEDPLHELDCKEGVLRDARFIRTQLTGLLITAENLDEFLRTGKTDEEARKLTTSLLGSIADPFQVKGNVLNELETSWAGFCQGLPEMPHPEETFLVVVTSRFYLTSNWDQVSEGQFECLSVESEPHYIVSPQYPG
ncbi:hypothetical protein H9Q70_013048 [Fusarium xylarioides]|nr:hypothetical protein H9Q70_013048 [Fusarium xylarioides]